MWAGQMVVEAQLPFKRLLRGSAHLVGHFDCGLTGDLSHLQGRTFTWMRPSHITQAQLFCSQEV